MHPAAATGKLHARQNVLFLSVGAGERRDAPEAGRYCAAGACHTKPSTDLAKASVSSL
ncbi:hypothetical protein ABIC83_004441 [Roseateles asaccharophilus]|uniref:Uncharacterized protein n=1 Tax=Roseateles asaccharophilus TaxID=582607 RepID=A0ABU2A961_9BURK|nr:hypothetical protein [Roseateles asaccharophilus]